MQTSLSNAIVDANGQGRSDIANQLQKQLNDVNNLLDYINGGQLQQDISDLNSIINSLSTGQIDYNLSNQIGDITARLNQINTLFNNMMSDYKDLGKFKDIIIKWDSRNAAIFSTFDAFKTSIASTASNSMLGWYLDPQKGLLANIFYGDSNQIGLTALKMRLTGMVDFNIVEKIYTFITGDPNGANWSKNTFDGWGNIGIPQIIIGFILTAIADVIMFFAAWRVAQGWVIIFFKWIGSIPVFAKGSEEDLRTHIGEMFTVWIELFFTYLFFELSVILIPLVTAPIDAAGIIGKGASLMFIDASMAVSLLQARRSAMLFGTSDGIDYYAKRSGTKQATDNVSSATSKTVKSVKSVSKIFSKGEGGGEE